MSVDKEDFDAFIKGLGISPEALRDAKAKFTPCSFLPSHLELGASGIEGEGVFARRPVREGEMVANAIEDGHWTEAGLRVNHAVIPNVKIERHGNAHRFIATRSIDRGDEITTNYRQIKEAIL